jgi:hypothetical protein
MPNRPGRPFAAGSEDLPHPSPQVRDLVGHVYEIFTSTGKSMDVIAQESGLPGDRKNLSRWLRHKDGPNWGLVEQLARGCARLNGKPVETYLPELKRLWQLAHPDNRPAGTADTATTGEPDGSASPPPAAPDVAAPASSTTAAPSTAAEPSAGAAGPVDRADAPRSSPSPGWLWRKPVAVVCAAAVLIAGGVAIWFGMQDDDTESPVRATMCAAGVQRAPSGECTGVTAEGFAFLPDEVLGGVFAKIREENTWVAAQPSGSRVVTIAYLMSLPFGTPDSDRLVSLRHELEGAYLAQWRANHDPTLGKPPLVRLLVANNGNEGHQWQPVAEQLIDAAGNTAQPLLAVAGLGESRDSTRHTIAALDAARIPMVSTVLSADDLALKAGARIKALIRVGPTNSGEGAAINNYLVAQKISRPLLIEDTKATDQYAPTLAATFRSRFAEEALQGEIYDTEFGDVGTTFHNMMANICARKPDMVYFAGRGVDLASFVEVLPSRPCPTMKINIITGDSATNLTNRLGNPAFIKGLKSNVSLKYATMAHPGAWTHTPAVFPALPVSFFNSGASCDDTCFSTLFPGETLDDGQAVMGHDAVFAAISGIRLARPQTNPHLYRGAVIQQWNRLNNTRAVPGASGWISLNTTGNPENKAIPIIELTPQGARVVHLGSSSTDGHGPITP